MQRWKGEVRGQSTEYRVRRTGGGRERRLGWHAVPTLPEAERNGEPGSRILEGGRTDVAWRTDATQSRPYPMQGKGWLRCHRNLNGLTFGYHTAESDMYPKPAVRLAYDTTRGPPQGGLALFKCTINRAPTWFALRRT